MTRLTDDPCLPLTPQEFSDALSLAPSLWWSGWRPRLVTRDLCCLCMWLGASAGFGGAHPEQGAGRGHTASYLAWALSLGAPEHHPRVFLVRIVGARKGLLAMGLGLTLAV